MQRFTGTDVISELLDQIAQRAAVREPTPPATPHRFMREDALAAVVVDELHLAARIDFHAGVAIHRLAVEEPAAVVGDDPDYLVDLLGALALQGEFVFFRHGGVLCRVMPGRWRVVGYFPTGCVVRHNRDSTREIKS